MIEEIKSNILPAIVAARPTVDYPCKYTIGFCGLLTGGKSTSARAVQFLLTPFYNAKVCSFAYDVYRIAYEFGWDGKKDDKGRKLLQWVGTEVGRNYDPNVWIKYAFKRMRSNFIRENKESNVALFDDLRFVNEVEWIKNNKGVIIKVTDNKTKDTELSKHVSESGVPDQFIDYEIRNNYNIFHLMSQLYAILKRLGFKTLKGE